MSEVMRENKVLRTRLNEIEEMLVGFEEQMESISTTEMQFREVAGLAGIDPEVRKAGIGGPGMDFRAMEDLSWLDSSSEETLIASNERLSELTRRADLVFQSLIESVEQMEFNNEKFTRTPSIWPTSGRISSRYGVRAHPIFGGVRPHEGIDIYASRGTPIVATADGRVVRAGWKVGYGLTMLIDHDFGYETFYAHCSKLKKKKGDRVKRGDVVALVGNTGITTGSHLHYEVMLDGKSVDPSNYILGHTIPD
jgi:murein DD-endopeptidase MepM/ murein hydrolase activator NlpD